MTLNIDLLALACAEYCERDGQKGVFIPEVPNFKYTPGTGTRKRATPARAIVSLNLYKSKNPRKKYDSVGQQLIPQEYLEAYLANPNTVMRSPFVAYGYNSRKWKDELPERTSSAADIEKLLED